jgi:hypothetical protein
MGYDTYNGKRLDIEYIKHELVAIYGDNLAYHYNKFAEGAMRGCVFIYPVNKLN